MQQAMQEMLAQSLAVDDPEKALRIFITAAAENQEIIKKLMHSQRREQVECMLFHAIQDGMMQLARDKDVYKRQLPNRMKVKLPRIRLKLILAAPT